ncbi:MAG TPA: DUF488 family protein [Mycobacterium sp.]|nr:DUF488 family protein [Mycobacterium sp.]
MRLARVYDPPQRDDGLRILADRLWPRGVRKDDPRIDRWCKDAAPSSPLRRWYNHDPGRYDEFVTRYEQELDSPDAAAALDELHTLLSSGPITLLTSARDVEHGHLPVLARLIERRG